MSRVQEQQHREHTRCVVEPMTRTQHLMEIDALQQHGDKKCHTCGRFGHLEKDCWQNKSKGKGKDCKGKGGKKGKGKGKGKTDKDVCLKCGQRGHWTKNCPNPAKAIHGLDGQNDARNSWWQWNDGQEWKAPSEQNTDESQRAAPTQPMAEPEAAMVGLWLASLTAGTESEQSCETSPAAEIMSLEGHAAERITFGVDSGCGLDGDRKGRGSRVPKSTGTREMNDGLPRESCGELEAQRNGFEGTDRQEFCKSDRAISSQEPAVGEFLVADRA